MRGSGQFNKIIQSFQIHFGATFVFGIDVLLLFERLFLAQDELPRLEQFLIGTVAVQRHQLQVFTYLHLRRLHQLLQHLLLHYVFEGQLGRVTLVVRFDQVVEDLVALLGHEGNTPREQVHKVGQQVGVRTLHELLDVQRVVLRERTVTSNLMTAPLLL